MAHNKSHNVRNLSFQITKRKYGKSFRNHLTPEWEGEGRDMVNLQLRVFSLSSFWKVALLLYTAGWGPHFFLYFIITNFFFPFNLFLIYHVWKVSFKWFSVWKIKHIKFLHPWRQACVSISFINGTNKPIDKIVWGTNVTCARIFILERTKGGNLAFASVSMRKSKILFFLQLICFSFTTVSLFLIVSS